MVDRVGVNVQHRTCSKCGISKPETVEFFRPRGTKHRGGLRPDCRECSAARDRLFYERNKLREQAKRAAYRARTKAEIYARDRRYLATENGRTRRNATNARWRSTPVGRAFTREAAIVRRARLAGVRSDFTPADWRAVLNLFGHCCAYCGSADDEITVEHVVPLYSGGHHTRTNVVPACRSCNSSKWHRPMVEWFTRQPFFDPARLALILDHAQATAAA